MGDAPALATIGTTTKGRDARLHPTAAALWAVTVPLVKQRLGIDLTGRIIQAYGSAAASAGTHGAPACAIDIRIWSLTTTQIRALVALLRDCGWEGAWWRDWDGNEHIHACTDIGIWTPALYQIKAARAGYDGLGAGGRKGKDPHPAPKVRRTAKQGTVWAAAQLIIPTPASTTVPEEDIMASLAELRSELRKTLTDDKLVAVGKSKWSITHVLDWLRRKAGDDGAKIAGLQASVKALASKQGVDVDKVYKAAYDGALAGADEATEA